jgi:hypothetical protein
MFNQRSTDSLDYDVDLDLAPQIVETVGTGMAPDNNEELDVFVSLEARIEDILVLRESILESCGMSQAYALEAQRLLPDFDNKNPIGFYTVAPSATRYAVAIEELSSGVWTLIAAGIAAVIAIIAKFFKWLGKGDEKKAEERIQEVANKFEEAKKKLNEVEKLLNEGKTEINGKYLYLKDAPHKEHYSLDALITAMFESTPHERRLGEFLQTKDPYFHDLVNRGPYLHEMARLATVFKSLQIILRQRLNAMEAIAKMDLSDASLSSGMATAKMLREVGTPIEVEYEGKTQTLQEIRHQVMAVASEVKDSKPEGHLSFDTLFSTMSVAMGNSEISNSLKEVTAITPLVDKMRDELETMRGKAGHYGQDGKAGHHSTTVGTDLRHAIFVLGEDLAAMSALTAEVLQYQHRMLYLAFSAADFAEAVAMKLSHDVQDEQGRSLEKWKKIAHELKQTRKELHFLYTN